MVIVVAETAKHLPLVVQDVFGVAVDSLGDVLDIPIEKLEGVITSNMATGVGHVAPEVCWSRAVTTPFISGVAVGSLAWVLGILPQKTRMALLQ